VAVVVTRKVTNVSGRGGCMVPARDVHQGRGLRGRLGGSAAIADHSRQEKGGDEGARGRGRGRGRVAEGVVVGEGGCNWHAQSL
jgi:hypothetical protein